MIFFAASQVAIMFSSVTSDQVTKQVGVKQDKGSLFPPDQCGDPVSDEEVHVSQGLVHE